LSWFEGYSGAFSSQTSDESTQSPSFFGSDPPPYALWLLARTSGVRAKSLVLFECLQRQWWQFDFSLAIF